MLEIEALTRKQVNLIRSLKRSKGRSGSGLFIVEGLRICQDVLQSKLEIDMFVLGPKAPEIDLKSNIPAFKASRTQIEQVSDSKSPQEVMLLARVPTTPARPEVNGLVLGLDRISDPGNLGTILRSAHWFGVRDILLSPGCADPFAPKAVRASMGAVAGLNLHRNVDLDKAGKDWLDQDGELLALHMQGENISGYRAESPVLLLVGSEAHGLDQQLLESSRPLVIPSRGGGESLNAAMATGIALYALGR